MTASVLAALETAWSRSDALFALLADAWLARPIPLRHPFIFYLGHLPAFAWNQVGVGLLDRGPLHPEFDDLFEFGIDPLSEDAATAASVGVWPGLPEVLEYRDRARAVLRAVLPAAAQAVVARGVCADPVAAVLEHELMHHETLTYLLYELGPEHLDRPPAGVEPTTGPAPPPPPERIDIPAGTATLGAGFDELPFGWDNEFPRHVVPVPAFTIDRYPVTVAEFLRFVDAGGYADPDYWSPADREWLEAHGQRHPHHWTRDVGGVWQLRTMFDRVPLTSVSGWPVVVTWAEAAAYARWRGARLPTEAECHRAAYGHPAGEGQEAAYPWGAAEPRPEHGNFGGRRFDPVPVGSHPAGQSAFGVDELVGNGWEWTATDFGPFPGFEPRMPTYPGYSADFFGQGHKVLFGGSWATPTRLLRRSFRNWFQPHYPWVFATFRCVLASRAGRGGTDGSEPV